MINQKLPSRREPRKLEGEFAEQRQQRKAAGKLFSIGLYKGLRGRVLTNYVQKVMSTVTS